MNKKINGTKGKTLAYINKHESIQRSRLTMKLNQWGCNGKARVRLMNQLIKQKLILITYQYNNTVGAKPQYIQLTDKGREELSG